MSCSPVGPRLHAQAAALSLLALAWSIGVSVPDRAGAAGWSTEPTSANVLGGFCSLALGSNGQPFIAHSSSSNPGLTTKVGGVWSTEPVTPPSQPQRMSGAVPAGIAMPDAVQFLFWSEPSLALDPEGDPRIAYMRVADEQPTETRWAAKETGAWSVETIQVNATAPSLAVDAQGRPHVSYDQGSQTIYATRDGGWVFETVADPPGGSSLRLDGEGNPCIAIGGGAGVGLRYAVREPGGWTIQPVAADRPAYKPSLVLDATGEPRISYYDSIDRTVRFAQRNQGIWTTEEVGPAKSENSLALDPLGRPFIAYTIGAASNRDLGFARRANGVWTTELVDTTGDTGHTPALVIDPQGRPHIAYFDQSTFRVEYTVGAPLIGVAPLASETRFAMTGIVPNPLPVGGALQLSLRLPEAREVRLELYDAAGRRIAARPATALPAGVHELRWSPATRHAGLHFVQARTDRGERFGARLVVVH